MYLFIYMQISVFKKIKPQTYAFDEVWPLNSPQRW